MEDVSVFTRGPLRSRPFRCGRGGETLSMVGDASYQIVFVSLVLSISRSPAALAAVLVATALPRGGAAADRCAATVQFSPRTVRLISLISHLVGGASRAVLAALAASGGLQGPPMTGGPCTASAGVVSPSATEVTIPPSNWPAMIGDSHHGGGPPGAARDGEHRTDGPATRPERASTSYRGREQVQAAPAAARASKARVRGHDAGVVAGRDLGDEHRELSKRVQKLFSARNRVAHRGERLDKSVGQDPRCDRRRRDSIPAQGVPAGNDGRSDLVE